MFYRSLRLLFLTFFLTSAVIRTMSQCVDTEPRITGPAVVCESAANIVKYSTPNVSGHSYSWSVQRTSPGTGGYTVESSSNPYEFNVRWTDVANFRITLLEGIIGDPCTPKQAILDITSQPYLAAYFYYTFDPNFGCYYNKVGFTGDVSLHSALNPITFFWDFGEPTAIVTPSPTAPNPTCEYPYTPGVTLPTTYTVTLTITDAQGRTDKIIDYVYVDPDKYKPDPQFTSTPVGCLYDGILFDASLSKPTHDPTAVAPIQYYLWDFDDPANPNPVTTYPPVTTVNHVYTTPNTYHVKLTIMNSMGCSESLTLPVTVSPSIPIVNFSNLKACLGNPTQFTDLTDPIVPPITAWYWDFDDAVSGANNFSTLQNPTHTFSALKDYYPSLRVTNSLGCVSTYKTTVPVTVSGSPLAFYTYLPPKICEGEDITFTDGSDDQGYSPIDQLLWDFAGQGTSDQPNPVWNFPIPNNYPVTLTVTNADGCSSVETKTITVNAKPPLSYITTPGPNSTLQVLFDATTIPTVGNQVYWTFGDGTTGYGLHVDKTYPFPGIYDITVTARDMGSSCETTITGSVTVGGPPSANFAAQPPYQCQNSGITFIPADPGGILYTDRYHYDDGTPDDLYIMGSPNPPPGSPTHFFASPGLHTVVRTVNEGRPDVDTKSVDVYIFTNPYAHFKWYADAGYTQENKACAGETVYFKDFSTPLETNFPADIVSWSWNFGDPTSGSNTSDLKNPSHVFTGNNQTYHVTLTVTDMNGCSTSTVIDVYVNPTIPVDYNIPVVACVLQPITFQSVGMDPTTIASWTWSFGDGTPNTHDPVSTIHAYQASAIGIHTTTLTVTDINGCTNSTSRDINVIPSPTAGFTYSSPTCEGSKVYFTNESVPGGGAGDHIVRYEWYWNDGSTPDPEIIDFPNDPNISHTFPVVLGTYSWPVRLRVTNTYGCSHETTVMVNLLPAPVANFGFQTGTYQCAGQAVEFKDLSDPNGGGAIVSWLWNFGDPPPNNTGSGPNPLHTYATDGTYTVTLTVTTANGCSTSIPKDITVNKKPVADFTFTTVCEGDPTVFTDQSTPYATGTLLYLWDMGNGVTFTVPSPSYVFPTAGIHTVTLTVTNSNGCFHQTTKDVMVNPKAIALFHYTDPSCANSTLTFYSDSYIPATPGSNSTITNLSWDFGDGGTGTGSVVAHTYTDGLTAHMVVLTVTTSENCVSTISHIINHIPAPIAGFSHTGYECEKQTVSFYDNSSPANSIASRSWVFGDPGSGSNNYSTLQNPTHDFSTFGDFTVTLIVTDYNGCVSTVFSDVITILPKPVAAFSAPPACLGAGTIFTDESTPAAGITQWLWQYDDGQQDNIQNPIHFFATSGTHSVVLTVTTSSGCFKSVTKQVEVYAKPVVSFGSTAPACGGNEITFNDLSTTAHGYITTRIWNFGDGPDQPPTPNPTITHTYATGGQYNVTLTVNTSDGCVESRTIPIQIQYSPHADFYNSSTLCQGMSVQFTSASSPNGGSQVTSWHWNFGDPGSGANNQSDQQNPTHIFTTSGDHLITYRATNADGCYEEITRTITINARPVADFTASSECQGTATEFTDQSTAPTGATIVNHYWTFGDGGTSSLQDPTHTYANPGIYNVTLKVTTDQGCFKDTTITVEVYGKPLASFTFSSPTCSTDSIHFSDLSSTPHGSISEWKWNFGDGSAEIVRTFPESPNVVHKYANGGTFNVTLTITTTDNCTAVKILPVMVQFAPLANFEFSAGACEKTPLQFTDLSQSNGGGAVVAWSWNFGDPASGSNNTSNEKNPTHAFTGGGDYDVTLIVTNSAGCMDTVFPPKTVTVNSGPVAKFTADTSCVTSPTQFTDGSTTPSGTIIAWDWNFGDPASGTNNTSQEQNPSHTYNSPGTYSVTLVATNSFNCTHDTVIQVSVNPKPQAMFEAATSCVGDSTYFTDLSIAPGSSVKSWLWDFGDGGTSTLQNPSHVYTTANTYSVKLVVKNLANCEDSVTMPVVARPKPIAAYSYVNFFCPAGQVNFQDESQGQGSGIVEHYWIFEPGYTSTLVNPQHTFLVTDTTYLVSLIVTDTYGCKDTIIDSVYVKPGFSFTFSNDTVCHGYQTQFHAINPNHSAGDSLYSVVWNFGDPNSFGQNTSYLYNPTHIFTQPGLYVVKLKAWNSDNCVDSVFREIQVYAPPKPAFAWTSEPCDSTLYFADTTSVSGSGTIASWEWRFGDGSAPVIIPAPGPGDTSHLYVNPGIYPVTLIITNTMGCIDSITTNVERFPCIRAVFDYSDTLLCARYQIAFSDSSLPISRINEWHWTWGDGKDTSYTVHSSPITHTYANAGTYNVTLAIKATVNGTDISDSVTRQVTIHPTPMTYFSNTGTCLQQPSVFLDTSDTFNEPVYKWYWNFGEPGSGVKDTSTFQNPTHNYGKKGIYDVKLVVMNRFGCKDSLTKPTRVYGLPIAHYTNTTPCTGDPTYFEDISSLSDTTIGSWKWNFGDTLSTNDTSTIQNPEHKYKYAGSYDVRMIVRDFFGCMDTVDSTVTVNITPTSAFTVTNNFDDKQGNVKLNNSSEGASSYDWDFGNGQTSTEENPIVTYTEDGTYVIKLISLNEFGCSDTTFFEYKLLFKGLYVPNAFSPTNTNLAVRLFKPVGTNLKQYHVTVFDTWGHLMWESTKLDSEGRPQEGWDGTFNGNLMPQGTYMWKITALFVDDSPWNGGDIGKGEYSTMGTVTLIR